MLEQLTALQSKPQEIDNFYRSLSAEQKSEFQTAINKLHKQNPDVAIWGYWHYKLRLPPNDQSGMSILHFRKFTPQLLASLFIGIVSGTILWALFRENSGSVYSFWYTHGVLRTALTVGIVFTSILIVMFINYRRIKQPVIMAIALAAYYVLLFAAGLSTESGNFNEFFTPTILIISFFILGIVNFAFSTANWKLLPLGFSKYVAKFIETAIVSGVFYIPVAIIVAIGFALFTAIGVTPPSDVYLYLAFTVLATVPLIVVNLTYDFANDVSTQLRSPIVNLVSGLGAVLSFVGATFLSCYIVFLMISGLTNTFNSGIATNIFLGTILVALGLIYLSNLQLDKVQGRFVQALIAVNTILSVQSFILTTIAAWAVVSRLITFGLTLDRVVGLITLLIYFTVLIGHAVSVGWLIYRRNLSRYLLYLRSWALLGLGLLAGFTGLITVLDVENISLRQHVQMIVASDGSKSLDKSFLRSSGFKSLSALADAYGAASKNARIDIVMTIAEFNYYYYDDEQKIPTQDALNKVKSLESNSQMKLLIDSAYAGLSDFDEREELETRCKQLFTGTKELEVCGDRYSYRR